MAASQKNQIKLYFRASTYLLTTPSLKDREKPVPATRNSHHIPNQIHKDTNAKRSDAPIHKNLDIGHSSP